MKAYQDIYGNVFSRGQTRISTFVGGLARSFFSTRNSTLLLQNGHYIEVVCPFDHPSIDGKAIEKIIKVEIAGDEKRITDWLGNDLATTHWK